MSLISRLLLSFFSFALCALAASPALAFSDVSPGHPHAEAVESLAARGIISGYTDGRFGPADPVRRAQFAKMIVGTLGLSVREGLDSPFVDLGPNVTNNLYPHEYVSVAYAHGITRGKTATSFAPYDEISRAQAITMVVRALDQRYPDLLADPPADFAPSWPDFSADHTANAKKAEYNDLLIGLGRDDTHPRGNLTALGPWGTMPRSEVAQVLDNALRMLPRTAQQVKRSPAETAQLLADPATAEEGVWSLLANLGLGVYTPKAGRVMQGSETSFDDFFLFDFEIRSLVIAAGQPGPTTTELLATFHRLGIDIDEEDFLGGLQRVFLINNDGEFLPELFRAMGVRFEADEELSRLQEFLLLVDALVPKNGTDNALAAASTGLADESFQEKVFAAGTLTKADSPCQTKFESPSNPLWGYVSGGLDAALGVFMDLPDMPWGDWNPAAEAKDAMHAKMMYERTIITLVPEPAAVHEQCPDMLGKPESSRLTVYSFFYGKDLPEWFVDCVKRLGFDIPPHGPTANVGVTWEIDGVLARHGYYQHADKNGNPVKIEAGRNAYTDEQGRAFLKYTTIEEAAKGEGAKVVELGEATAVVQVQQSDFFNKYAGIQEIFAPKKARANVAVEYHQQPWHLKLRWHDFQEGGDLVFQWDFEFMINKDQTISGWGTGSVNGKMRLGTESGGTVMSSTSAAYEYRIESGKARVETAYDPAYGGAGTSQWIVFRPGAFVPTAQSMVVDNPDVRPEDEEYMAKDTANYINLLIEDSANFGQLRVPMLDGRSSYMLVPGAKEERVYFTISAGSE